MSIEVILFDWGGTLSQVVRQDELLRRGAEKAARMLCDPWLDEALNALLARVMVMEKDAACHPELREADFSDVLLQWAAAYKGNVNPGRLQAAIDLIGREWIGSLEPFPDSADALRSLRTGNFRMGLVSNCMFPPEACQAEFERHGFAGLLDFLVFSSGVGYRKPSPRIYEAALARAYPQGRPSDLSGVLFVGDSPTFDIAAPAAMGMKTALVTCKKGIWTPADYAKARPDFTVDSIAELPELLM